VTTREPVVVEELAVFAVNVTAAFAAKLVNAPLPLVPVAAIFILLILLVVVGAIVTVLAVSATVADDPFIVTSPLNAPVVATKALPSSLITT
jgi:hypothetical protein